MTCILGCVEEGKVYIGADSATVAGWEIRQKAHPKIFRLDRFLVGSCGSVRIENILQYHLSIREQSIDESDMQYMVTGFVSAVRSCLKDSGYTKIENNREEGGTFLVGFSGHLYCIYSDFQVAENADNMNAIGCGREYALGAFKVLSEENPKKRILDALKVSAYFSMGVAEPFEILSI